MTRAAPAVLLLVAACSTGAQPFPNADLLGTSRQHVLVVVDHANDTTGWMYRFGQDSGHWTVSGAPVPVTVGAGGVAKVREGDKRAPTGAYPLTRVFGYADTGPAGLRMPYLPLRPETECVDDEGSQFYNQVVNPSEVGGKTWNSSEIMRRDIANKDDLYKLGLLVAYNPDGHRDPASGKGAGSCIFMHIWRAPAAPTVGCTAMPEDAMNALVAWLDPADKPLLVQGTRADLEQLARTGTLPYGVPPRHI